MIRSRPETNTKSPPGQIVNPLPTPVPCKEYKPVHGGFPDAHKHTQGEWDRYQQQRNKHD